MSLVKTSNLKNPSGGNGHGATATTAHPLASKHAPAAAAPADKGDADSLRRRARTLARQQQAAERLAAASTELNRGVSEASSAAQQLKTSMAQIGEGGQENAKAAQEALQAMNAINTNIGKQKDAAGASQKKTDTLQAALGQIGAHIGKMVKAVSVASERQSGSVQMIEQLEQRANDIGEIVKAVARIADQTNLLALNAAIEAARAGQYGKGFAVVADEVRTLAETSEKSARDIEALVKQIQDEVKVIATGVGASASAARSEVEKGTSITTQLEGIRGDMITIASGANEIMTAATESERAAREAQQGAETIAAAAEEQSAASDNASRMVDQQATALSESDTSASALNELADELKNATNVAKSAEQVAASAEELSSAVQEITRASQEIMGALEQIQKGAQQQAAATRQAAAAAAQIERSSQRGEQLARAALDKGQRMSEQLIANRTSVEEMITGLSSALEAGKKSQLQINALELVSRRIDKIVEAIAKVSIQTNMLAVNGSIEAARAGEYGKGFVVVSTDIRNLAQESAENAERIKDLVKAVQDQIRDVRKDLDEIGASAMSEVEAAKAVMTLLGSTATEMADVLAGNTEIGRAAQQIMNALQEAKKATEVIASAAEQTNKAATESSSAAQEQAQGAAELARAIDEIASLAEELQSST